MGGKSTLLRQVCIAVIMAHIGCYVNASKCELSLVDRIFTRIGAWDNIFHGQSTFMVELQETSLVLSRATKNSLVIMDELGRGTSTFDGYSIAYSTLSFLASQLQCRTLFSTHYHMLTEESMCKGINPSVALKHMSALVGGTSVAYVLINGPSLCIGRCLILTVRHHIRQGGDDTENDVVFLYKMEAGASFPLLLFFYPLWFLC
jgi:DNA mismatch repair ATPase MutS